MHTRNSKCGSEQTQSKGTIKGGVKVNVQQQVVYSTHNKWNKGCIKRMTYNFEAFYTLNFIHIIIRLYKFEQHIVDVYVLCTHHSNNLKKTYKNGMCTNLML